MVDRSDELKFNMYCDLILEKVKYCKNEFSEALDLNSKARIRTICREMKDAKYLFVELQSLANLKKKEMYDLFNVDLEGENNEQLQSPTT